MVSPVFSSVASTTNSVPPKIIFNKIGPSEPPLVSLNCNVTDPINWQLLSVTKVGFGSELEKIWTTPSCCFFSIGVYLHVDVSF